MTIAKRVRDLRYAKGWGPDELASRAEISRTALYQIECGKTETPRAGTLKRIAKALDVSIEALLGRENGTAIDLSSFAGGTNESATDYEPPDEGPELVEAAPPKSHTLTARLHPSREADLHRKFHELLVSPMAESVAKIIEETYRVLPHSRVKRPG